MGKTSAGTPVADIMTRKIIYVTPEISLDQCMGVMTDKRIRHLPVLEEGGKVLGVLSIGDLVREKIADQASTIEQLEHYIHG